MKWEIFTVFLVLRTQLVICSIADERLSARFFIDDPENISMIASPPTTIAQVKKKSTTPQTNTTSSSITTKYYTTDDIMSHFAKAITSIIQTTISSSTTAANTTQEEGSSSSSFHHEIFLRQKQRYLYDDDDFSELNEFLKGAVVIRIPDQNIVDTINDYDDKAISSLQLNLGLSNIRCYDFSIGDIIVTYKLSSNQKFDMTFDILELALTCSLDYQYTLSGNTLFSKGKGQVNAFMNNSSAARYSFSVESSNFNNHPPTNFNFKMCGTDNTEESEEEDFSSIFFRVSDLDISHGGSGLNIILDYFENTVNRTIEKSLKEFGCSTIMDMGNSFGSNIVTVTNEIIHPLLEELSPEYTDPLYLENALTNNEIDLLNFQDIESELGNLIPIVLDVIKRISLRGEDGELEINKIIREKLLEDDGAWLINNVSNLDFLAPDNDGVIFEGQLPSIVTKITLERFKIYGLDTFIAFDPLIDIGKYTLASDVILSQLDIEAVLTIDIRPTINSTISESLEDTVPILETITLTTGFEDLAATLSVFLAIDQEKLESLTLESLLPSNVENLTGCLLSTIFDAKISGFDVSIGDIHPPMLKNGFESSPGIRRVIADVVDSFFIIYEGALLKALPNAFQSFIRDILNTDIIDSLLEDTTDVCQQDEHTTNNDNTSSSLPSNQPSYHSPSSSLSGIESFPLDNSTRSIIPSATASLDALTTNNAPLIPSTDVTKFGCESREIILGESGYNNYVDNVAGGGNMFNIIAATTVTVRQIGFMFNGGFGNNYKHELYKRKSSYDEEEWELISSGSTENVWPEGAKTDTISVHIPKGTTQSFYIRGVDHKIISRWSGNTDDIAFENSDIVITRGCAAGSSSSYGDNKNISHDGNIPAGGYVSVKYDTDFCATSSITSSSSKTAPQQINTPPPTIINSPTISPTSTNCTNKEIHMDDKDVYVFSTLKIWNINPPSLRIVKVSAKVRAETSKDSTIWFYFKDNNNSIVGSMNMILGNYETETGSKDFTSSPPLESISSVHMYSWWNPATISNLVLTVETCID